MFNVGGGEVLVIMLIALIVLGPEKLPNAARQAGKYLGDFRRMSNGFQRELRDAMDLNDLTGLTSSSKPTSAGGPTPQPRAGAPTTAAATTTGEGASAAPAVPSPAGSSERPVAAEPSIEVDGPSASFD